MKGNKTTTTGQTAQTNNNTSSTLLDPAIQAAAYNNLNSASDVAAGYNPVAQGAPVGFNANQQQGQQAILNAANNNAGGDVLNGSIATNQGIQNFQPMAVGAEGYTGQGYNASLVDPNQGYQATLMGPAAQAQAAQAAAQGFTAAQATGAQSYNPVLAGAAAQLAPGTVQQVTGPNSASSLPSYLQSVAPQFQQSVIQPALDAINEQRIQALQGADGQAAQAGAFGGDRQAIYDAQTNKNYAAQAAQTASNLGLQGFSAATGLLQNDQGLGQAASLANQSANLQAGTTNAGFQQQTGLANQSAQNAAGQFGATALNTQALTNAQMQQQAAQYGAEAANAAALQNAQQATAISAANANSQNANMAANQTASNTAAQFDSNQAANLGMSNQTASNNAAQFGANAGNVSNQFNANASNTSNLANQTAGIAGAALRNNAATSGAAMSDQIRNNAFGNAAAVTAVGDTQQAQDQKTQDVAYNNAVAQNNAPLVRLGINQNALGLTPYGTTTVNNGSSTGSSTGTQTTSPGLGSQIISAIGGGLQLGGLANSVFSPTSVIGGAVKSDERLKTNIRPMNGTSALSKVAKLKGVSYNWKGSGAPDLGLVAQDVGRAMPGAVSTIGGVKHYSAPAVLGLLADGVNELHRKVNRKGLLN